ncbi:MAG: menaquinone biosynthesis protein [Planctomycetes bacterium]|nr:menaquinone biosynthesis protein [Planctomycetota bacterium]MCB9905944.1 menaquinone biosynthesis protein [Planctomycetota bacterium]
MRQVRPLRVGSVPYLVGRPLDVGLEHEPGIELVREVPARLVELLRAGELDVALVSSIELFRRPGYRYIPGMAVTGAGHVSSVQLFLRKPIAEVKTIALDPASRTAATLIRVLLAERAGGAPDFVETPAGEDPRQAGTDAWLRIGDPAMRETYEAQAHESFNPSAEWTQRTGLPFVFAPWIVREGVDVSDHLAAFARSRELGRRRLSEFAARGASEWKVPTRAYANYFFEQLDYDPGEVMHRALFAFRDHAARLGLCEADLAPEAAVESGAPRA